MVPDNIETQCKLEAMYALSLQRPGETKHVHAESIGSVRAALLLHVDVACCRGAGYLTLCPCHLFMKAARLSHASVTEKGDALESAE